MFGEEHKGHKFQKLNEVYEKHVKLIKGEAENLRSRLKELNSQMNEVQVTIDKVTKAKEEKTKEIDQFIENINAKYNGLLK
jgi:tripartite motif-containing protein 37